MSDKKVQIEIEAVTKGSAAIEKMQDELRGIGKASSEAAPQAEKLTKDLEQLGQAGATAAPKAKSAANEMQEAGRSSANAAPKINQAATAMDQAGKAGAGAAPKAKSAASEIQGAGRAGTEAAPRLKKIAESIKKVGDESEKTAAHVMGISSKLQEMYGIAQAVVGAALAKRFLDANIAADSFQRTMQLLTGSTEKANEELKYIATTADRLGIPIRDLQAAYSGFAVAMKGSALEGEKSKLVFEAVAHSMAVLGKSSDDTKGVLLSLEQMMSKGTVQSEELKGQLGERLPGAFALAAKAIKVTEAELNKLLETGQVAAVDLLPKLAEELNKTFGDPQKEVESLQASVGRFQTAIDTALVSLGQAGVIDGFAESIKILASVVVGAAESFKLLGNTIGYTAAVGAAQIQDLGTAAQQLLKLDFAGMGESLSRALHQGDLAGQQLSEAFDRAAENLNAVNKHSKLLSGSLDNVGEAAKQSAAKTTAAASQMSSALGLATGTINLSKESADKLKEALARALDAGGVSAFGLALATIPPEMRESTAGAKGLDEALKKLDGQQLASLQAQLKALPVMAGDFASVLKQITEVSLKKLGLDADQVLTGISKKSQDIVASFKSLAEAGTLTGSQLAMALKAAFTTVDSEKAVLSLKAEMVDLGKKGKLTGEQIAAGMQEAERALNKTHKAVTPLEEALDRLGLKTKKALQFEADQAVKDLALVRAAVQRGELAANALDTALERVAKSAQIAGLTAREESAKTELLTRKGTEALVEQGNAGLKAGESIAAGQRIAQNEISRTVEQVEKLKAAEQAAEAARRNTLTPVRTVGGPNLNSLSTDELTKAAGGSDGTNGDSVQQAAFNILQQRRNTGTAGSNVFGYNRQTPAPPPPPPPAPTPPPRHTPTPAPVPTPQPVMPSPPQEVIHRIELSTPSGRSISLTANSKMDVDGLLAVLADAKSRSAL